MLPLPMNGQIASAPCAAIAPLSAAAMRSSASFQEIRLNSPLPLGPTRRNGYRSRPGDCV
jgi:hypothetical protein